MSPAHPPTDGHGRIRKTHLCHMQSSDALEKQHGGSSLKLEHCYEAVTELPGPTQVSVTTQQQRTRRELLFPRPRMQGSHDFLPD